jgi:peptide/nickel transport system permease protein
MNRSVLYLTGKRLLFSVFLLFLLITFIFLLLHAAPGNPIGKYISPELNPDLAEKIRDSFGLNDSLLKQYSTFLSQAFTGNLGISFNYRMPVLSVIGEYLPFTVGFALLSFTIQLAAAIGLSLMAAKRKGSITDKVTSNLNLFIYALPSFFIGVMLIFIFSELLKIFPSSGLMSHDYEDLSFLGKLLDLGKHLALPLITLTLTGTAVLYRYLRENMDEAFNSGYVLYLKSNGIPGNEIIRRHILPNAVSPLIAIAGIELGILFSGTLITEVIFGLPGMGRLTVQAILVRDYPLVTGCALISGVLIIASNFFADIVKVKMDKRLLAKGILD